MNIVNQLLSDIIMRGAIYLVIDSEGKAKQVSCDDFTSQFMTLETVKSKDGKLERVMLVDKKDCKKAFLQLPIIETASDIVKSRSVVDDIVTYMSEWLEKKGNNLSCDKDVDNGIYGCSIVPCHRMQPEKEKNGSWVTHAGPSYALQIYGIDQDEAFKLGRDMKEKIQLSITVMYLGSEPERSLITG